jgi:hypothetical protein
MSEASKRTQFQIGNQLWRRAAGNVGNPPMFNNPQELLKVAVEYFTWCDNNPIMVTEVYGKDAKMMEIPKARAFTIHGLCLHANMSIDTFYKYEKEYPEYKEVYAFIRSTMFAQKFEGAAVGMFNPNIIARDLQLVDKKEVETKGQIQHAVLYVPDNGRRVRQVQAPPPAQIEDAELAEDL